MIRQAKSLIKFNAAFIVILVCLASFSTVSVYAQEASSSSLRLIGTIEGTNLSGGVFQDKSGQQLFYRLHEKLSDGSEIVRINDDSISLKGPDGTMYDMFISHEMRQMASAAPATGAREEPASALKSTIQRERSERPTYRDVQRQRRVRRSQFEDE